jgi:inorganic pyrophosphatase
VWNPKKLPAITPAAISMSATDTPMRMETILATKANPIHAAAINQTFCIAILLVRVVALQKLSVHNRDGSIRGSECGELHHRGPTIPSCFAEASPPRTKPRNPARSSTIVTTYIEIVPTDTVKYELDKTSGYLKVDRPQKFSSVCPTLYGLIPQTLCAAQVGALCAERTGRPGITGDGDPLDICVLTEKTIPRGDILLRAIPIGGLRTIDRNAADDKIIAVMQQDAMYGGWRDVTDCSPALLEDNAGNKRQTHPRRGRKPDIVHHCSPPSRRRVPEGIR